MKKMLFAVIVLNIQLYALVCPDFALLGGYSAKTIGKHESDEAKIAGTISAITTIIQTQINQTESSNLNKIKNIETLKESEALINLKNNFLRKKQNEVQSIINNIKAE